jgi:hypothetical protein
MTTVGAASSDGGGAAMLDRIIAELVLWGIRGGIAWLVAHEVGLIAAEKLSEVARALGQL